MAGSWELGHPQHSQQRGHWLTMTSTTRTMALPCCGSTHFMIVALLLRLVSSGFVDAATVSSKLQVIIPHGLTKQGGYDHREALFGVPNYGGSIQQNVYYSDSDNLCDATSINVHGGHPERPLDENGVMQAWPSPFILMIPRGGCSFVQKVRNAQKSGAAGVIIADNTCLCKANSTCQSDLPCELNEPIMADDGSGSDISIPSFLMFKQDADVVIDKLMANQNVRMEMAWALPSPDDRVEYELWTVPTDLVSQDFVSKFKNAALELDDRAYFTPQMYIIDGAKSGCRQNGGNMCYTLCTNNGRYCATDPDNDLANGLSGADVVEESLRRTCIWQLYGKDNGIGSQWWDYVTEFNTRCLSEDFFKNDDCIKDSMKHSGVNWDKVESCMKDSGGLDADSTNSLLEGQIQSVESVGVVFLPMIRVNNVAIRGALSFSTVFKAVCAGYVSGSEPDICSACANCRDEYNCLENKGYCNYRPLVGNGVSLSTFYASVCALVLFLSCVGLVLWKRSQTRMREEVRGILAEYMPLEEQNNNISTAISEEEEENGLT